MILQNPKNSLSVSVKPCEMLQTAAHFGSGAVQKRFNLVRTFGSILFSLGGLPERSFWTRPPKYPFLIGKLNIP